MRLTTVLKGLITYVPGMYNMFVKPRGAGGTDSAEYCYGVWLKHLTMLWDHGLNVMPDTVAELGPGASIGVGLAALLSGVSNYYALDVVKYANIARNLTILDELVQLFKQRAGRPTKGWPDFDRSLDSDLFPSHILTKEVLDAALMEQRVEAIRKALLHETSEDKRITIKYIVPWHNPHLIRQESVDLIFSHAVLEHVAELDMSYKAFSLWLKPQGLMSHQIDFTSHGSAEKWNGHWTYSEPLWKIIVGKRPYLINRQPYSIHTNLLKKNGFKILCQLKKHRSDGIARLQLSSQWKDITEDDLITSGAFVIARKMAN